MPKALPPDELWARSAYFEANPAAETAATITVTPDTGERAYVDWILPSWDSDPDDEDTITVTVGGVQKFQWRTSVAASIQGPQFFGPFYGAADEAIVITVSAPSAVSGATASLSIKYRQNATAA